jgi:GNAT superfamily N-acetyltransferase
MDYFRSKDLPVAVYLSPACSPLDLPARLLERGLSKQPEEESWMILEGLADFDMPLPPPGKRVKTVTRNEIGLFTEVFMAAFNMPGDFAPVVGQLLEPGVGLPNVYHYLALDEDDRPIGTCSLLCYESFGVLGSAGVLCEHRGRGAATALAVRAATEARGLGVETLMLQTAADTPLERLLRISGFKRAFTRSCYTLNDDPSG